MIQVKLGPIASSPLPKRSNIAQELSLWKCRLYVLMKQVSSAITDSLNQLFLCSSQRYIKQSNHEALSEGSDNFDDRMLYLFELTLDLVYQSLCYSDFGAISSKASGYWIRAIIPLHGWALLLFSYD